VHAEDTLVQLLPTASVDFSSELARRAAGVEQLSPGGNAVLTARQQALTRRR